MNNILLLSGYLHDCPIPWQTFVKKYNASGDDTGLKNLKRVLRTEFNATFNGRYSRVTFKSEPDLMNFLMVYG